MASDLNTHALHAESAMCMATSNTSAPPAEHLPKRGRDSCTCLLTPVHSPVISRTKNMRFASGAFSAAELLPENRHWPVACATERTAHPPRAIHTLHTPCHGPPAPDCMQIMQHQGKPLLALRTRHRHRATAAAAACASTSTVEPAARRTARAAGVTARRCGESNTSWSRR